MQRPEQAVEVLMVGAHERGIGVGVRRVLVAVTAVETKISSFRSSNPPLSNSGTAADSGPT